MTLFQEGLANYLKWCFDEKYEPVFHTKMEQIKMAEYILQEAIEGLYPDQCWWQTTKIKIFEELLGGASVYELCDLIAVDILKEKKND